MSVRAWIKGFFKPPIAQPRIAAPTPKLLLTRGCLDAISAGLEPEVRKGHEGIVYLLGRTDRVFALATTVFRPDAITTPGSFHVPPEAMATCLEAAAKYEMQVVGQLHTHPGADYHSDGDVDGARIRYPGYVSVVLPDYGRRLPSLGGMAAYLWTKNEWQEFSAEDLVIIPGSGPWTSNTGTTSATTARSGTARVV